MFYREVPIWLFVAVALFAGLGCGPLSDNNEGLYASIASEMLRTGHLVIPRLAGMPYIEKPPLLYWLIAASFELCGKTALAARLVPALAAFGTCVVMFELLRRLRLGREARICALVFASSLGIVVLAHLVLFDMLLVFGLTVSLAGICFWEISPGHSQAALRVAAAGLGVGILAKGLVAAVLVVAIIGVRIILDRNPRTLWLQRGTDPLALAILLGLVVPWHALAAWQQEGFTSFYFLNEHLLRFLGTREPHDFHEGPWYFYLPRLCLAMLPWAWIAPALVRVRPDPARARIERFLFVWAFVPLLFFSLSQAKADYYMVVCLPPLAGWIASRLGRTEAPQRRRLAQCAATAAAVNLLVVTLLPVAAAQGSGRLAVAVGLLQNKGFLSFALAAGLVVAPALAAWAFTTRWQLTAVGLFALQTLVILAGVTEVANAAVDSYSSEPLARIAKATCPQDRPLMVYASPEAVSAVLFYWGADIRVVDSSSADFDFARRHGARVRQTFIDSRGLTGWNPDDPLCVVVPSNQGMRFQHSGLAGSLQPIARISTAVLWGNATARRLASGAKSIDRLTPMVKIDAR